MSEWIHAGSELPPEGEDVLVVVLDGIRQRQAVMRRYQHWCWRGEGAQITDDGEGMDGFADVVTHWRRLPAPPPLVTRRPESDCRAHGDEWNETVTVR